MSVENIVSEVFNVSEADLSDDQRLQALESWDSMAHMMLITNIEDTFEIRFEGEEIISVETIGELKNLVSQKKS